MKKKKKLKKERKRTWLIGIRNFEIYIYIYIFKCHQRKNYQINEDIYCFFGIDRDYQLLEIYTVSWDRFILMTS